MSYGIDPANVRRSIRRTRASRRWERHRTAVLVFIAAVALLIVFTTAVLVVGA